MPSILFVCTANQFRSPLAAACFLQNIEQEDTDRKWIVESAGTWTKTGMSAPPITLQIADQLGLSGLDSHITRQLDQEILNQFDLIIVMERDHKESISLEYPSVNSRLHILSEIVDGLPYDIPDPITPGIRPDDVGRELYSLVKKGMRNIIKLAETPVD